MDPNNTTPNNGSEAGADSGQSAPPPENLLETAVKPGEGESKPPEGAKPDTAAPEWFWSDGVKGTDKPPEWFDGKKYKSVAEQAKAYPELFKKHGELASKLKGFTGAPEKYELTMPEDIKEAVEWQADDPLLTEFQNFARESGMSQDTFTKALHMLAKYEYANEATDLSKEKEALGERADERLQNFLEWTGANLGDEHGQLVKRALAPAARPSDVFKAFEAVLTATRQVAMPKPGEDVPSGMTKDQWESKWYSKSEVKGCQYKIDEPGQRSTAKAELAKIVGTGDHVKVVGKQ